MTAERTAEEWGRVAVSLPGWRWLPGMLNDKGGRLVDGVDSPRRFPDPDDPATAGCLLALLGRGPWTCGYHVAHGYHVEYRSSRAGTTHHLSLGRACIAAAEALGRWPGGVG